MVRPRDSRVSLPLSPSLSLSFSLTQRWKKIESSPYPINFDEFRGGKTTDGTREDGKKSGKEGNKEEVGGKKNGEERERETEGGNFQL